MKVIETKQSLEEIIKILENERLRLKRVETREADIDLKKINRRLRDYRIEYHERFKCDYNYSP